MTYNAQEASRYAGQPIELYEFLMGVSAWRYTSGDETVTHATFAYIPEPIHRSEADFSREDDAASITVELPATNPVAQLFIAYTPPVPVVLNLYRQHRSDAAHETVGFGPYRVASAAFAQGRATLTCAPISQSFKRMVPAVVYQYPCVLPLYSARCGVLKASFATSATLSAVTAATITASAFTSHPNGWYLNGYVERTNGDRRFIVGHVGTVITLVAPFPPDLVAGETVTAYAGCQRTEAECAAKFNNLVNHFGFARIPSRNPNGGLSII